LALKSPTVDARSMGLGAIRIIERPEALPFEVNVLYSRIEMLGIRVQ
jgi:hypothetical protein